MLAFGVIVVASNTEYKDLFTAMKGGGNNFGVVTRLDFRVFEQGPMWGGRITYESSAEMDEKLMNAFVEYKSGEMDEDTGMWLCFARLRSIDLRLSYTTLFHSKPDTQPGKLKAFVDIGPQIGNDLKVQYAGEIARGLAEVSDTPEAL